MAKAKLGRNAPCRCGSGLKYKRCCLSRAVPLPWGQPTADPWVAEVMAATSLAGVPHGTLVRSVIHKGHRWRAVGNRLFYRPPAETFHEFLFYLLRVTLGKDWHDRERQRPDGQQHDLLKWSDAQVASWKRAIGTSEPQDSNPKRWAVEPTGYVWAMLVLAYDVFQLLHRGELPDDLLGRLRDPAQFQGARYEIAVAATFVRAGFAIRFVPRDLGKQGKVWEFTARDPTADVEIAVEAKSRHRPGVLGFPGEIDSEKAVRGDVDRLVNEALDQDPGTMPFVIFVDVNVPPAPGIQFPERVWVRDITDMLQSIPPPTAERPDPFSALVVTNYAYHWAGEERARGGEYLPILPKFPRHPLPGDTLGQLLAALAHYGEVPDEV
jgi:hypothetical protein